MAESQIARFRRVVSSAYASLEARRQEVNDLNVFPVADGDTGDNMAMTMRAVMEELDRLDGQEVDEVGRTELVQALARAALMGARGNSGVILSQIVRGAAEELASRPGELIDPVLVASAFASAADAAYDSVRDPAEGTMLTVFREMAHSRRPPARPPRAGAAAARPRRHRRGAGRGARRGPRARDRRRRAAVEPHARAARGAARIRRRRRRRLRPGPDPRRGRRRAARRRGRVPEVAHHEAPRRSRPTTRTAATATAPTSSSPAAASPTASPAPPGGARRLGPRRRRRRRRSRSTSTPTSPRPRSRSSTGSARSPTSTSPTCASRSPSATPASAAAAPASSRSPPATACERLFGELGAHVVPGGETLNPSTYELLAGIHERRRRGGPGPAQLLERDHGRRARLRALREAGAGGAGDLAAGRPAGAGRARPRGDAAENAERLEAALDGDRHRRRRPGRPRRRPGPLPKGDAVGFADGEIVAWGGAGSTLAATIEHLAEGAEIVTVIAGEEAPIPLDEIDTHVARRGRGRDPRGRTAELVVAAGRPVVRSFAGERGAERGRAARRARPLAAAERAGAGAGRAEGCRAEAGGSGRRSRDRTVGDLLLRIPHAHRDRTDSASWRALEPGQGDGLVEVLATLSRVRFAKARPDASQRQSRGRQRPVGRPGSTSLGCLEADPGPSCS